MALLKGTIKSALKLLLLVPLVLLVLWVNYFVDQTGLFRGDKFNLELAQMADRVVRIEDGRISG